MEAFSFGFSGFFVPLCPGGDLFDRLVSPEGISYLAARRVLFRLVKALEFIHGKGWVYRDVKLENIFLGKEVTDSYLADFGLSAKGETFTNECGTVGYYAPELALHREYTKAVDMWAVGVVAFQLFTKEGLFGVSQDLPEEVKRQFKIDSICAFTDNDRAVWARLNFHRVPSVAIDFVFNLLRVNPDNRMTAEQALTHPFLSAEKAMVPTSKLGNAVKDTANTTEGAVAGDVFAAADEFL
jgi:serine/threonine protein kinase